VLSKYTIVEFLDLGSFSLKGGDEMGLFVALASYLVEFYSLAFHLWFSIYMGVYLIIFL